MTTNAGKPVVTAPPHSPGPLVFPDPPENPDDKMTAFKQLGPNGNAHHLVQHLGNPDTTLVSGELYISPIPTQDLTGVHYPDLLIAFDVDPAAYYRSNAYVISEQGKPPDFVLEIASRSSGRIDTGAKREAYAALRIPEYWRFDETGRYHRSRLAGDRLEGDTYVPVHIDQLAEDVLQGYSRALNLLLRWERGVLKWHDPVTERHIVTFNDLQEHLDRETAGRLHAEARVRELEAELGRLRNQSR